MRRIRPATAQDKAAIPEALSSLREARTLLRCAGADRACKGAARAITNHHVGHRIVRTAA